MKNKKRYFILGGLVLLLLATGYLNYRLNNNSTLPAENDTQEASTSSSTFFFRFQA
jgi:hypothetical protein